MDSETFNFEKSHELNMTEMALMNANTTILPHNQPHEVQFGQMELHKKSFYEIVSPYILKMAQETGSFAMMAGSTAFDKIKNGLLWVYDKIKNTIIPYVSENAPKVIFLISNKDKKIV